MKKKTTHGGARPGSGRKDPVTKEGIGFSLSLEVIAKIKGEKKRSDLAEKLFRKHYKLPPLTPASSSPAENTEQ